MSVAAFVDTNVLLYSVSRQESEARKRARAREVLAARDLAISCQVVQEFYSQAVRPGRNRMTHDEAVEIIGSFKTMNVLPVTMIVVEDAMRLADRYHINYWDAAIVAAARQAGAPVLFSEDLNDGQDFEGVIVSNPFRK